MRLALTAILLAAAIPAAAAQSQPASAGIALTKPDGASAGNATLREGSDGIVMRLEVTGLPVGWHGLHFHMVGDCSDGAAGYKASGAHVGHGGDDKHGLLNPEGPEDGDLPNIYVGAEGGMAEIYIDDVKLADLTDSDGTALIIHANEDDHTSQPIGNAGDRIACGTVGKIE